MMTKELCEGSLLNNLYCLTSFKLVAVVVFLGWGFDKSSSSSTSNNDESSTRLEERHYLLLADSYTAGTTLGEPLNRMPAVHSLQFEMVGTDHPILFPSVPERGVPLKQESTYSSKSYSLQLPLALLDGKSNLNTSVISLTVMELDPDDPTHDTKRYGVQLIEKVDHVIDALKTLNLKAEVDSEIFDANIDANLDKTLESLQKMYARYKKRADDDFVGAAVITPRLGKPNTSRIIRDNNHENRGSISARIVPIRKNFNIKKLSAKITEIIVHPECGIAETGENKNVELFLYTKIATSISEMDDPGVRWPEIGTKKVNYNDGILAGPIIFGNRIYTRTPDETGLPFIYLEALVLDEDKGRGSDARRDPADMLGLLSVTITPDKLLAKAKREGSTFSLSEIVELQIPAADKLTTLGERLSKGTGLMMTKGGRVTLSYRVEFSVD